MKSLLYSWYMIKTQVTRQQIQFITDTVFEIVRFFIGESSKKMKDTELNSKVVNVTMSKGIITGMFLEGNKYLMTIDKNVLSYIN